jgi:hypothetical protein
MITFERVNVYNWLNAIHGMRNSWESWDRIDSEEKWDIEIDAPMDSYEVNHVFNLGPNDKALMMKLGKAGPEHAKYLRQIFISVDITAPLKFWDEMDTYHFFETNSTSAMHTLGRGKIEETAFSMEDFDDDIKEDYLNMLNAARERWFSAGKKKPSREWRQMVFLTAMGFNYKRTWTSNYAQLRTIYFQRRLHRLQEWRDMAAWIESLPYSELITLKVGE